MSLRVRVVAVLGALLLCLVASRNARAADQPATVKKISSLRKSALAAYGDGDIDKAKAQLMQAVALSKQDSEVAHHPETAQAYLLLGVVYIDGLDNRKTGVEYLGKAVAIDPDIEVPETLATKSVLKAFDEVHGEAGSASSATAEAKPARSDASKTATTGKQRPEAESQAARDKQDRDKQDKEAQEKAAKELAQLRGDASNERGEIERLKKENADRDAQIRDGKAALAAAQLRIQKLEKDTADREKLIAAGTDREKKERDAKEALAKEKDKLAQEKVENERAVADLKKQVQQLQSDKQDRDKLIAAGLEREKNERDAKEKLDRERQAADARDKERRKQEESAHTEREKLAAGPDLPAHIGEPITCALPDEAQAGVELFVHCAPQQGGKVKELAIYYRTNGVTHYNSLLLKRSRKGWYTAALPADQVNGKLLQYYVEALDGQDGVVATNGKASSPNVLTLKGAALVAGGAGAGSGAGALTEARSVTVIKRHGKTTGPTHVISR